MKPLLPVLAFSILTAAPPSQEEPAIAGSKDLRRIAIELKREPKARLRAVARATWTGQSDELRAAAAELLVRLELNGAAVEHVAPGLRDPDPRVRARAAGALRRLGYPQAGKLLGLADRKGGRAAVAPRQHVAFLEQQGVLRDFHVEVA